MSRKDGTYQLSQYVDLITEDAHVIHPPLKDGFDCVQSACYNKLIREKLALLTVYLVPHSVDNAEGSLADASLVVVSLRDVSLQRLNGEPALHEEAWVDFLLLRVEQGVRCGVQLLL